MPLQTWIEFLPTLIQARHARGLSQATLAAKLGVATSAISLWEARLRTPAEENAELWAAELGVKLPKDATLWFKRKTWATEPRHGTRNGYQWHRRHNDLPACLPCRTAAARYAAERRY